MGPEYWWGHGFGFMWIFPLIFLAIFIYFMRGKFGQGSKGCDSQGGDSSHQESAREILDKRFAKEEINKEEYESMKETLGKGTT